MSYQTQQQLIDSAIAKIEARIDQHVRKAAAVESLRKSGTLTKAAVGEVWSAGEQPVQPTSERALPGGWVAKAGTDPAAALRMGLEQEAHEVISRSNMEKDRVGTRMRPDVGPASDRSVALALRATIASMAEKSAKESAKTMAEVRAVEAARAKDLAAQWAKGDEDEDEGEDEESRSKMRARQGGPLGINRGGPGGLEDEDSKELDEARAYNRAKAFTRAYEEARMKSATLGKGALGDSITGRDPRPGIYSNPDEAGVPAGDFGGWIGGAKADDSLRNMPAGSVKGSKIAGSDDGTPGDVTTWLASKAPKITAKIGWDSVHEPSGQMIDFNDVKALGGKKAGGPKPGSNTDWSNSSAGVGGGK